MPAAAFQRVVLKLSGESLAGGGGQGYDFEQAGRLAREMADLPVLGCQIVLVIGGGNLLRGRQAKAADLPAAEADRLGMLATVMNALGLSNLLERAGAPARVLTATPMPAFAESWSARRARELLAAGEFVIAAGGTGQPFFTTDTCAALRAIEIEAELLIKATTVDGVYAADPKRDPGAERFPWLDYDEVLRRRLQVMDATAFALCREHSLPIRIFDYREPGAMKRILQGEDLGSLVSKEDPHA